MAHYPRRVRPPTTEAVWRKQPNSSRPASLSAVGGKPSVISNAEMTEEMWPSREGRARPLSRRCWVSSGSVPETANPTRMTRRRPRGSFCLDIRLANDPAELVVLFAEQARKISAADAHRIKSKGGELGLQVRRLQCAPKPVGKLGQPVLRRLRRRRYPDPPVVHLGVFITGFRDGGHIGQRLNSRS